MCLYLAFAVGSHMIASHLDVEPPTCWETEFVPSKQKAKLCARQNPRYIAVAQKHVSKRYLGRWTSKLKPA